MKTQTMADCASTEERRRKDSQLVSRSHAWQPDGRLSALGIILAMCVWFGASAQAAFTNLWGSGPNVIYWNGEIVTQKMLPGTNWPGNSGFAEISGDPTNYVVWYDAKAGVDFSTNAGPNAMNSMEESGPSVEIKANAVAGALQLCGYGVLVENGNGYGDHPREIGNRVTDVDKGTLTSYANEWVDGTVLISSGLYDYVSDSWSEIRDFYGWHVPQEGEPYWGRTTTTNQYSGIYSSPGMTSEVCSNYFYSILNGPGGDTNNVWHYDFLTRAADTVYRVYSGNVAESQTNTVIINVTGIDLASYVPTGSGMFLSSSPSYLSSFPSVNWSRISIRINGTTIAVDSSGNASVNLPNDTKTEFKVLVSPDTNGVVWADLTVDVSSP